MKLKIFGIALLMSATPYVAAEEPLSSGFEEDCQAQLQHFFALSESPKSVDIDGVPSLGMSKQDAMNLADSQGYCTAWEAVIQSFMSQHGDVLHAVEEKTGMPTPKSN